MPQTVYLNQCENTLWEERLNLHPGKTYQVILGQEIYQGRLSEIEIWVDEFGFQPIRLTLEGSCGFLQGEPDKSIKLGEIVFGARELRSRGIIRELIEEPK